MKEIKTHEELQTALDQSRSIIMFGKEDCLHCTIVKNGVGSIVQNYPLIGFYYTKNRDFATARNISAFPVLIFYENGSEQFRITGSSHIHKIRDFINLWIVKQ